MVTSVLHVSHISGEGYTLFSTYIQSSCIIGVLFTLVVGVQVASAEVNLELRVNTSAKWFVGDTIEVGLYAISSSETEQTVAGIDVILSWESAVLELTGLINNGPYRWLASWFPDDSKLGGLNAPFNDLDPIPGNDGDALYQAVMQSNSPATVTTEGLLVTTLVFTAIGASDSSLLIILPQIVTKSWTTTSRVLTDNPPAGIITGTLGSVLLTVLPCGFSGDIDFDCDIDLFDFQQMFPCISGIAGPNNAIIVPTCMKSDLDKDNDVDLQDFYLFQLFFSGS